MKTQLLIGFTLVLNLFITTSSATGGGIDASIPASPTVNEIEFAPVIEPKSLSATPIGSTCAEHASQEQRCIREYVEGRADETAYQDCSQRALASKYLCGSEPVASAQ